MGIGFKRGGMVSYAMINVSAQTGGTASGGGRFVKGRPVTVVAVPGSSYIFSGWYNGNILVSTAATYTFVLTDDIRLEARFIAQYTVSVSAGAGGTASGNKTANVGSSVTVTASPNTYYTFDGWYEGNTKVSSLASYTFTLTRNVTLQARFRIIQYTVSVSAADGGTASGGNTVNAGSSITVTAAPAAYHNFDGWYIGGTKVSGSNPYTFTPASDVTLTARFEFYSVAVSGGTMIRNADGSVTVSASVPADYTWNGWYNGSALVSTNNPYTFMPTGDISLTAKMTAPEWAGLTFYQIHPTPSTGVHPWHHSESLMDVNITIFIKIENEIVKSHTFTGRGNNGTYFSFAFSFGTVRVEFQWRDNTCSLHYLSGTPKTVYGAVKIG